MGKKGSSWLAAMKRAFRSPSKENNISTRKQETEHGEGKRREKRTWLFRKTAKPEINNASNERMQSVMQTEVVRHVVPTREDRAAIAIQTTFRGFLARRALKALRGLVKLQALIRGQNVRKQAKTTLQCMQALVRVQSQMPNRRVARNGEETRSCIQGRDGISILSDDWEEKHQLVEEEFVKGILHDSKRQFQYSQAASKQSNKIRHQSFGNEGEIRELICGHRWMGRASTNQRPINPQRFSHPHSISSPLHRLQTNHAPSTPSRTRPPPQSMRSASPRYAREEKHSPNPITALPNYMTPTESTKAKSRWHSAPRQRPITSSGRERGLVAQKRLTYKSRYGVGNDYEMIMRSPSFKSVCGVEEGSNYSSCCTTYYNESLVGS